MFKSMSYCQWPRDISFVDQILRIDEQVRAEFRLKRTAGGFRQWDNNFHVTKSQVETYTCDSHNEFIELLKAVPYLVRFSWHSVYAPKYGMTAFSSKRYGVGVDYSRDEIEIGVHAHDNLGFVEKVHQMVADILNLSNPARVDVDISRRKMLDPSVFVARHFDRIGTDYYWKLSDFLNLLGFSVVQGEEYTSQAIPEKVKRRIDQCRISN